MPTCLLNHLTIPAEPVKGEEGINLEPEINNFLVGHYHELYKIVIQVNPLMLRSNEPERHTVLAGDLPSKLPFFKDTNLTVLCVPHGQNRFALLVSFLKTRDWQVLLPISEPQKLRDPTTF